MQHSQVTHKNMLKVWDFTNNKLILFIYTLFKFDLHITLQLTSLSKLD